MCNRFWIGILFIIIGLGLFYYVKKRSKIEEKIYDWKGYIGGIGFVIFGIHLIYECLMLKDCNQ